MHKLRLTSSRCQAFAGWAEYKVAWSVITRRYPVIERKITYMPYNVSITWVCCTVHYRKAKFTIFFYFSVLNFYFFNFPASTWSGVNPCTEFRPTSTETTTTRRQRTPSRPRSLHPSTPRTPAHLLSRQTVRNRSGLIFITPPQQLLTVECSTPCLQIGANALIHGRKVASYTYTSSALCSSFTELYRTIVGPQYAAERIQK